MRRLILEESLSRTAIWSRRFAYLALPIAGFGLAFGRFGFTDLPYAVAVFVFALLMAVIAIVLAVFALAGIWNSGRHGTGHAITAVLLASLLLAYPAFLIARSLNQPRLNDITTDLESPPGYTADPKITAARGGFWPPAVGRSQRDAQIKAYPQVQPVNVDVDVVEAFSNCQSAVKTLHWQELEAVPPVPGKSDGRIEVKTRSLLMGIPYNLVIRIRATGDTSRIDLRSTSRLGAHDFGANAELITRFVTALQDEIDSR